MSVKYHVISWSLCLPERSASKFSLGFAGWLCFGCAQTPQWCPCIDHHSLLMHYTPFTCCTKTEWFQMSTCSLSWGSFSYIFLFFFNFYFWRDPISDVVVPHAFLCYHDDLWLYFLNELLPSYHCFFIWTYRAKAICSMTPFKVSENHPGWIWTMYLFVMLQLVALVMIIMCHKENILSLCTEQRQQEHFSALEQNKKILFLCKCFQL